MAKKPAVTLYKSEDTYHIEHHGYPVGGLVRFHASLGIAAILMAVPLLVTLSPHLAQAFFGCTAALLIYALVGYLLYVPFAMLSGRTSFTPKEEKITFSKSFMGKDTEFSREIPWEGKLETEIEQVGLKVPLLPLSFFRVKVITDFMTYHVATFGPGHAGSADEFSKAVRRGRYGRASDSGRFTKADVEALKGT